MKKILGLDLGVSSIGWALINENEKTSSIVSLGTRIIPINANDRDEFSSGNKISKNQNRTLKRGQRRGYDRYQMRRELLRRNLEKLEMLPDESLTQLPVLELWALRSKAVSEQITLKQIGRVLLHLNQKRGYKSSRSDVNLDKKDTEYVSEIKNRHQCIREQDLTIGQHFYNELIKNPYYRIKQEVFPREAYIEEFRAICNQQKKYFPAIITDEIIKKLEYEIIYYQRKLKSQKGLVSICEFEGFQKLKNDKKIFVGPRVAPKSSPLFQVCKLWETINNIALKNKRGETYIIPIEKKKELFTYLDNQESLSQTKLFEILGFKKSDGWFGNKQTSKGLQGNITKVQILKSIKNLEFDISLLQLNLAVDEKEEEVYLVDRHTGEIIGNNTKKEINADIEHQPFYQLWHIIYSITDIDECANALIKKFHLSKNLAKNLASQIDFRKYAFGNKSVKAMRKILPYLMEGYVYSEACSFAGYNHSNSLTTEERNNRQLLSTLPHLQKNSLRQPIVEKIVNQVINVVNSIVKEYGKFEKGDEIRIELARELKQSKDERNEASSYITKRDTENKIIVSEIEKLGLKATRNRVIKYRLFREISEGKTEVNATCIYCGKLFGLTDALSGNSVDVEHIIPKAKLFDDSQSNKTLSHRNCNENKGDRTAYDYVKNKSELDFNEYLERVNRITNRAKRNKLLASYDEYMKRKASGESTDADKLLWENFIERQLRETQYIAKKVKELLEQVSYNVWSTSGGVTAYLRKLWGWDDVLMNLQLPKYEAQGLIEIREKENLTGQIHKYTVIKDWSKRDDHRHHAIDALVVACTKQGFIQRLNSISSQHTKDEMYDWVKDLKFNEKLSLLDKYIISQKPFTTNQVSDKASGILVSFKSGQKVATFAKRKVKKDGKNVIVQAGIIVPRGQLHEEGVYGSIKRYVKGADEVFEKLSVKKYNVGVGAQGFLFTGKETISLKKKKDSKTKMEHLIEEDKVQKTIDAIVDKRIQKLILNRLNTGFEEGKSYKDDLKKALANFKNLDQNPIWFDEKKQISVKTVRMFTGLTAVEAVKRNENGEGIGFVLPKNNHHLALYRDTEGKIHDHICSFWHAVERKKHKISVVIKDPRKVWDNLITTDNNLNDFLKKLPKDCWDYITSMQVNEMFVFDMTNSELDDAIKMNDQKKISENLYRFQKTETGYKAVFRHHLATTVDKKIEWKGFASFKDFNGIKVRINNLGSIVKIEK